PRTAVARPARRAQRRPVGVAHRRAVERPARPLSAVSNVPSPLSAMATHGRPARLARMSRRGSATPRQARSHRRLHRRHLCRGEKGGDEIGPTRRGKGSKIMAICDGHGLPLAVHVASASPAEVRLVEATLHDRFLAPFPERLIGDRGYDSDPLDRHLLQTFGIELIARHRRTRKVPTQDGRALRRRRRRWKIERLFAWFHNYRRLVIRWERHADNFLAMLHLASALILLKQL